MLKKRRPTRRRHCSRRVSTGLPVLGQESTHQFPILRTDLGVEMASSGVCFLAH